MSLDFSVCLWLSYRLYFMKSWISASPKSIDSYQPAQSEQDYKVETFWLYVFFFGFFFPTSIDLHSVSLLKKKNTHTHTKTLNY